MQEIVLSVHILGLLQVLAPHTSPGRILRHWCQASENENWNAIAACIVQA